MLLLLCVNLSFATDNGTKLDTIQNQTEATTEATNDFYDYELEGGETKDPEDALNALSNKVDRVWDVLRKLMSKHALKMTLIISLFSTFMFFIFKLVRNKAGQKGALYMAIIPIIVYIIYMYLGPFLMSIN